MAWGGHSANPREDNLIDDPAIHNSHSSNSFTPAGMRHGTVARDEAYFLGKNSCQERSGSLGL